MGIIKSLFSMFLSSDSSSKSNQPHNLPDELYKYGDRVYSKMEKYEDYCYDIDQEMDEIFDVKKRLKLLHKAVDYLNSVKDYCINLGYGGEWLFENEAEAFLDDFDISKIITDNSEHQYSYEFQNMQLDNFNFLTYLINEYESKPDFYQDHLNKEKLYYEISLYGGYESYVKAKEAEQHEASVRRKVLAIIKKEKAILQTDIYKSFEEADKTTIRKYIKELEAKGKVSKTKQGNTYMINYESSGKSN